MPSAKHNASTLQPEESWNAIHDTVDRARTSMYVAGMESILLLWGAIVALGLLGQYAVATLTRPRLLPAIPGFPRCCGAR